MNNSIVGRCWVLAGSSSQSRVPLYKGLFMNLSLNLAGCFSLIFEFPRSALSGIITFAGIRECVYIIHSSCLSRLVFRNSIAYSVCISCMSRPRGSHTFLQMRMASFCNTCNLGHNQAGPPPWIIEQYSMMGRIMVV